MYRPRVKDALRFYLIQMYLSIYSELTLVLTYCGFLNSISEIQELIYDGRRWEIKSGKAMHCFLCFGSKVIKYESSNSVKYTMNV